MTFSEAVWRQDGEVKGNGENPLSCHSQGREGGWGDHPAWAGPLLTLEQQSPPTTTRIVLLAPYCTVGAGGGSHVYEQLDQPAHLSACPPLPPLPTLPLTVATSQERKALKRQPAQALLAGSRCLHRLGAHHVDSMASSLGGGCSSRRVRAGCSQVHSLEQGPWPPSSEDGSDARN